MSLVPCPFHEVGISGPKSLPGVRVSPRGEYDQNVGYIEGVDLSWGGYVEGVGMSRGEYVEGVCQEGYPPPGHYTTGGR